MSSAADHTCAPPDLATWDHDEDWTCPSCGKEWFVGPKNFCYTCNRSDGPEWVSYGTGDGRFPRVSAARGGIRFSRDS